MLKIVQKLAQSPPTDLYSPVVPLRWLIMLTYMEYTSGRSLEIGGIKLSLLYQTQVKQYLASLSFQNILQAAVIPKGSWRTFSKAYNQHIGP